VLIAVIILVVIQGNFLPPYLPNFIVFGWVPFQLLNYWLYAVELSVLGWLLARQIIR
jgi:hypothetical protein